jgi:hypothetical protein
MKDTIDTRQDSDYQIIINKSMDLNPVYTCEYYTGNTTSDAVPFDFTAYSAATLTVKQNYRSTTPVLEFSTTDGSIVLGTTGGTFQLVKSAAQLANIQTGDFKYNMYLSRAGEVRRAFLFGDFIIKTVII